MCDTKYINECECVAKGTIAKLRENEELSKVNTGTILNSEKTIEKALTVKDVGASVLFGFVDGFLGGMATDLKEGWKDGKCQDRSEISAKFKNILRKAKHFWYSIKSVHKKVWTSAGRKHLINALKGLLTALVEALKATWKFAMACPATKMIGVVLLVIIGMVLLNMAFVAAGWVVLPLLVKLVGGLVGLYFSFDYMKDTVIEIYKEMKKISSGKCTTSCKKRLIEKSSAMIGAITKVILLGGLGDFGKVSKNPASKSLFKKYKVEMSPSLIDDINVISKSAKNAKDGAKTSIKGIGGKLKGGTKVADDVADVAKVADDAKGAAWK